MKRIHLMMLPFSFLLPQVFGCVAYPFRAEEAVQRTAACKGIETVAVETRNGAITIRCDPLRTDVDIKATKYATGTSPNGARALVERIEVEAGPDSADPKVLRIAARFPPLTPGRSVGVAFDLAVPANLALRLVSSNGRIEANGAANGVDIRTSNGRITVTHIEGNVCAVTHNGAVTARDVAGDVDVETSNGRVELENVGKGLVRVETSNGVIRAAGVQGNVNLRSSNGPIELHVASLPASPNIRTVTSNGRVRVYVPDDVGARLEMRTSNGGIKATLDGAKVSSLQSNRRRLIATLNDGGGSIEIVSSNGWLTFETVKENGL